MTEIIYLLKTGISYRDLRSQINSQTIYFHFKRVFLKFQQIFAHNNTLNVQLIDSTFIMNKFGTNKISLVTDVNGIPLYVCIY